MILNQQTAVGQQAEKAVRLKMEGHDIRIGLREFCEGLAWVAIKQSVGQDGKIGGDLAKMAKTLQNMRTTKSRAGKPCSARTLERLCAYVGIEMPKYHF